MRNLVTFQMLGHYGRLCNQMYQIAGTIGIARRNGFDFAFPPWMNWDHKDRFGSEEDINLQKYFVNPLPLLPEGVSLPDHPVPWGYHEVNLDRSVSISGHLQSFRYFEHCFEEVKWYFRMFDEYPQEDTCAIHVRLGDYDNAYHPRLGMNYYDRAMAEFPADQKFLVFSDDTLAAREMFLGRPNLLLSINGDYIEDFKRMKSCRHFIIGNSSYSAFAAILGEGEGKRVVAPSPWFGPAHAQITGDDIYNEDWKVIHYLTEGA